MRVSDFRLQETSIYIPVQGERVTIPIVLSRVPAGFPSPADDYIEKDIDLNEWLINNKLATFIVRVEGDSMAGEIHSGDWLVVDRSVEPKNKSVVVACVDGELLVKRLRVDDDGSRFLVPENPDYPLVEINGHKEVFIWGVVRFGIHKME